MIVLSSTPYPLQLAIKEAEHARIAARHVRRDAMDAIKLLKDDLPSDEVKRLEKNVQQLTNRHVGNIDQILNSKVKAIESS